MDVEIIFKREWLTEVRFEGRANAGRLWCRAEVPEIVVASARDELLGRLVEFDHEAGKWLHAATIVAAVTGSNGTTFELAY